MFIFKSFFQVIVSVIRMIFVGVATAFLLLAVMDIFLTSSNGVINLIIMIMSYSFFPLFAAIFVEVFFHERRKHNNKAKKLKKSYNTK